MTRKGLFWVNSRIISLASISETKFLNGTKQYISRMLSLQRKSTRHAGTHQSTLPTRIPYLTLYPVKDINFLGSEEFNKIPLTSQKYFGKGTCYDVAEFDFRFYDHVDEFQKDGVKDGLRHPASHFIRKTILIQHVLGPANLVMSAGLTPAKGADEDFNAWYRDEHYGTLAQCTGYIRTRRFKLTNAVSAKDLETPRDVPRYPALHEFDVETIPQDEVQKTVETGWLDMMCWFVWKEFGAH
jgi:hypothetical protein